MGLSTESLIIKVHEYIENMNMKITYLWIAIFVLIIILLTTFFYFKYFSKLING